MSITGDADADGGHPTKVGVAISDVVTGLYAVVGILAAVLERDRGGSGRGQRVDASLLASTLAVLVNQAQNGFVTGRAPGRRGNAHPNIVPYETFATSDGELAVAVGSERQWVRLCAAIGRPELATDPRFATNGDRVEHRVELRPILAAIFAGRASSDLARRPGSRRDPRRGHRRHRDGVRLAGGGGTRDGRDRRASCARGPPPGGHPAPIRADARHHPERAAPAR